MKRTLYVCRCYSLKHMFVVSGDEEDLFIEVHLNPLPLWNRVKNALGYLIGRRSEYGDFEEILLSPEMAMELGDQIVTWASGESAGFVSNDVY